MRRASLNGLVLALGHHGGWGRSGLGLADGVEQILTTRGYFQQLGQLGFGELDHGAHPVMIARRGKVIFFKLAKLRL
jgi:hypothetical protein